MASPLQTTTMLVAALAFATATATATASSASSRTFTIAGAYETKSTFAVTASRIDLDQKKIEELFRLDSERSSSVIDIDIDIDIDNNDNDNDNDDESPFLSKARTIYEHGMHAGPYAELTLATQPTPNEHNAVEAVAISYEYTNDLNFDTTKRSIYTRNVVGGNQEYRTAIHGTTRSHLPRQALFGKKVGASVSLVVSYPEGSTCNVDGNLNDCFAGPDGGLVLQGYGAIDYTYDPHTDNRFSASLRGYSVEEGERMLYCELHGTTHGHDHDNDHDRCKEDYPEYQRFYDYYGILDYGHYWIHAAMDRSSTVYTSTSSSSSSSTTTTTTATSTATTTTRSFRHGNQDFSGLTPTARNAAVSTATVAMNVFSRVNRLMLEFGIDACTKNENDFSGFGQSSGKAMESAIAGGWDAAVATYAGSALIRAPPRDDNGDDDDDDDNDDDNDDDGSLYFHTVRTLAHQFGVLERHDGARPRHRYRSVVNRKILDEFRAGRDALRHGDCRGAALDSYRNVVRLMRVPWIQGVLGAAFVLSGEEHRGSNNDSSDKNDNDVSEAARGTGAAYAAALLPDLHSCSPAAAETVYNEFRLSGTSTSSSSSSSSSRTPNYRIVREALEHQYQCLGVTCDDVGGYLRPTTKKNGKRTYFEQTRPCGGYGTKLPQRRESVTYDSVDAARAHNHNNDSSNSSSSNSKHHHQRSLVPAAFLVCAAAFCASLKVLHATINQHARRTGGRGIDAAALPGRFCSAVSSRVDDWRSGGRNDNDDGAGATRGVQLQCVVPSRHGAPADSLL